EEACLARGLVGLAPGPDQPDPEPDRVAREPVISGTTAGLVGIGANSGAGGGEGWGVGVRAPPAGARSPPRSPCGPRPRGMLSPRPSCGPRPRGTLSP